MPLSKAATASRARLRRATHFQIEALERRVLLSSAIAAFGAQQTFGTGSNPRSVAVADVNGDGKLDLLVTNSVGNTVSVLLGNGSYQTQQTFSVGSTPFSIAAADLNLDGKLDLITANNGGNNVSVLLGNGNGTFQSQKTFGADTNSRFVAVADVNGDGKPDLLIANYGAGTISVLLGNGNGTFANQQTFSAGTKPSSIAVGNFNIDGKLDLAVVNKGSNNVSILLGNGNGTFQTQQAFSVGSAPFSIAAGDLNQDGKLDLVTADESSNAVSVLLGNGNGTFQTQQTYATGTIPASVAISDINGDGKLDVVAANYSSNSVSVLLGNGNGTLQPQKTFATGTNPFAVTIADVNRDGRQDLLAANEGSGSVGQLLGDVPPTALSINRSNPAGPSTSASSVTYAVTFNESVSGVDPSDSSLTASGVTTTPPLVVSGSGASYSVTINGISGNGTLGLNLVDDGSIKDAAGNPLQPGGMAAFQSPQDFNTGAGPVFVDIGDINADGKPDLVVANEGVNPNPGQTVSALLGNGNGTFQTQQTFFSGPTPRALVEGDYNGDGKVDLAVVNGGGSNTVTVLPGNGNGTFQAAQTFATGSNPQTLSESDVNGDGKMDLLVANFGTSASPSSAISVLLGNGNRTFQPQQQLNVGSKPLSIAASDVNGDGHTDLVVANYYSGTVSVLLGNGNGTFKPQQTLSVGLNPESVALADINSDGRPDIIVANSASNTVSLLLGNGDGTFSAQQTLAVGKVPISLSVLDLNGDGKLDLITTNLGGDSTSVLFGNGDGTFKAQQTLLLTASPCPLAIADLNADGRQDLVTTPTFFGNVAVTYLGKTDGGFTGQTYTITPNPPVVVSINRSVPATASTSASSVTYALTFSESVTGVDASDFRIVTSGGVVAATPVSVSGSGSSYSVTVSGIHGSGWVQLNLVDDDSIHDSSGTPLGGAGLYNGSFTGQSYTILQRFPTVVGNGLNRLNPSGPTTSASSVSYAVNFSTPVTGVDASDFQVVTTGSVTQSGPVVSGGGSSYTVTIDGVSGSGTLELNLPDNGPIRDLAGNPLQSLAHVGPTVLSTSAKPNSMAAADLNSDGKPDLVDANPSGVGVLMGNGNGTFQSERTFAAGSNPVSIALADLNGDGSPDVVVANPSSNTVSVLVGNGDGTLRSRHSFAVGVYPLSVAVADVNGDGRPDIITANQGRYPFFGNTVSVLLGNGNGTFASQSTFAVGGYPRAVAVADMNGDGNPDLVVLNYATDTVSVLLGNGNGSFQSQLTFSTGAGSLPKSMAVADISGDGKPDVVVADSAARNVGVLLGNGDGTLQTVRTTSTGGYTNFVSVADVNGDGLPDVIRVDPPTNVYAQGVVVINLGTGGGTFSDIGLLLAHGSVYPTYATAAEVNLDGRPDILLTGASNAVEVMLGGNAGTYPGQFFTIAPPAETINGTAGNDAIILTKDTDGTNIDWTMGSFSGHLPISDVNGLTINGNGDSDTLIINSSSLPNTLHLNGTFTINGLQGSNPLANTTLEIGRSTAYISYGSSDPLSLIQGYLKTGFNNGAWNGGPTASTGVIISIPAANNALQTTAIGYADSADGLITGQPANTIELKYTLYGDPSLTGSVGFNEFARLTQHYNQTTGGTWDTGDFNYDGSVSVDDFTLLARNYNSSLGSQAAPSVQSTSITTNPITSTVANSGTQSLSLQTQPTSVPHHHKPVPKHPKRHRR